MTHRPTGPACGNNPNHPISDGDRQAVEDFKAYLEQRGDGRGDIVRYRKRPVEVDTIRWTGDNEQAVQAFTGGPSTFYALDPADRENSDDPEATATVYDKLHSTWVLVYTGQHIVRGVKGEYYPIAEDVLAETYERADAVSAAVAPPTNHTAADDAEDDELVCVDQCGSCDACGMEPFGTPAEGWRQAAHFLRRTARASGDRAGALHGARMIEAELRRMADEPDNTQTTPEACAHCGQPIRRVTSTLAAWWVHDPGGNTVCDWARAASSTRATPQPAAGAQDGGQP
ncbi:hypothetical protein ACPXCH_04550 [Streptomyces albogriseolus]|uniref:hypothetical protein n=1 Tax=Streptomyces albogriseolus TaxID=1887 RepID=UPI003CEC014C